jgi:hypothetical protein
MNSNPNVQGLGALTKELASRVLNIRQVSTSSCCCTMNIVQNTRIVKDLLTPSIDGFVYNRYTHVLLATSFLSSVHCTVVSLRTHCGVTII